MIFCPLTFFVTTFTHGGKTMASLTFEIFIRRVNQEQRWKDMSRPAFCSPANRSEVMRLLAGDIDELKKFKRLVNIYDKKN